jgi:hypothetical protein
MKMMKHSLKKRASRGGRGSRRKKMGADKTSAMESIDSIMQLYKLQGVLLAKLQDQIKKMEA